MNRFVRYQNGNYVTTLDTKTGTKIRENDLNFFRAEFPESMDIKICDRCDMGCPMCFKADAKIQTNSGMINICDIKVGDIVLSYNFEKNLIENMNVTKLYERHYNGEMITIETDDGKIITCTPNHKVYTNRGYVRADKLTTKDEVMVI